MADTDTNSDISNHGLNILNILVVYVIM